MTRRQSAIRSVGQVRSGLARSIVAVLAHLYLLFGMSATSHVIAAESKSPFSLHGFSALAQLPSESKTLAIDGGRCHTAFWEGPNSILVAAFCELSTSFGFRNTVKEARLMLSTLFPFLKDDSRGIKWGETYRVAGPRGSIEVLPFTDRAQDLEVPCAGFSTGWDRREAGLAKALTGAYCSWADDAYIPDSIESLLSALRIEGEFEPQAVR